MPDNDLAEALGAALRPRLPWSFTRAGYAVVVYRVTVQQQHCRVWCRVREIATDRPVRLNLPIVFVSAPRQLLSADAFIQVLADVIQRTGIL